MSSAGFSPCGALSCTASSTCSISERGTATCSLPGFATRFICPVLPSAASAGGTPAPLGTFVTIAKIVYHSEDDRRPTTDDRRQRETRKHKTFVPFVLLWFS